MALFASFMLSGLAGLFLRLRDMMALPAAVAAVCGAAAATAVLGARIVRRAGDAEHEHKGATA